MWIVIDLETQNVLRNADWHAYSFGSRAEAEKWHQGTPECNRPFFVELPENGKPTSSDHAAQRALVVSKLQQLAEKNGGLDVLQTALEFLSA